MHNRVVIIGGGFCGTVLAANLLRRPPGAVTEIVLIERRAEVGRGVAYAVHGFPHLLNVPAGRLSADSGDPGQFLRFAQQRFPAVSGEDFLPRELYGDYLQDFLAQAQRVAEPGLRLVRVVGEATHLERTAAGGVFAVHVPAREPFVAGRVILALGNPTPPPQPWAAAVRGHAAYHADPWAPRPAPAAQHRVLIVGNGLTMADVVFSLSDPAAHTPLLMTISRRGLLPLPQSTFHAAALRGDGAELLTRAGSIRQIVAVTRAMARDVQRLGGDWREVVTFVRTLAPNLWQRLPEAERRRFVRHVQGHWDVHRHRVPPQAAARIASLRQSGRLDINAGRIEALAPEGERVRVIWRRRGEASARATVVDAVINATGPDYALHRSSEPLVQALRREGHIVEDGLNLGLRTAGHGACIAGDGRVSRELYYLGPMLRAGHWEATAAAELRNHAEHLARHLAEDRVAL